MAWRRYLGLSSGTSLLAPAQAPPDTVTEPWICEPFDDTNLMSDYENALTD